MSIRESLSDSPSERLSVFSKIRLLVLARLWYTISMKYDYLTLYQKNADFYNAHPRAKRALQLGNTLLTVFFLFSYALLWIFALFIDSLEPQSLLVISFVPAVCLFVVCVLRWAIDKPRPYAVGGAGITPFVQKKKQDNKSFPSRHTACAFVIAITFTAFYPIIGGFLIALAALLAYVRFAAGLHYPSDLFAGGLIGSLIGGLAFLL